MKTLRITALLMLVICLVAFSFASCEQLDVVLDDVLDEVMDKIPFLPEEEPTHEHTFADATCTAPKTCECGATEGEALGHNWTEATCKAPKTCSVCKATEGTLGAHKNDVTLEAVAPTCTESGLTAGVKCSVCGTVTTEQTTVPATGHTFIDGECSCGEEYVPSTVTSWVLSTELKSGDLVLIGAPAHGKLLSAEKVDASSYYNKGVDYSADNFANVTDAEIFVVTVNDDGSYTFTSLTGKVIALADSYSSLNDTGVNKTWTLTDRGDGTFLMKNVGRGYYLEWYSSKNNWSSYSAGNTDEYYLSFYVKTEVVSGDGEHVHNHISDATAPTCTEAGYTTYTCACGDTYTKPGEAATGHSHTSTVTDPTCTEDGYTTFTCSCGDTYTEPGEAASGHNYVEGTCTNCGGEDPDYHVHDYNFSVTTTANCTTDGVTTYTCSCGDFKTEDTAKFGHVDANLDVECDRSGCTSKVAPAADSVLSNFTANSLGSKLSTDYRYYVVGTIVEVLDQKNGIFLVDDGTGETFYFRLPVNADGVSHANWEIKLTLGDKVKIYGKINKFSSNTAPNGQYWPAMQGPVVTLLEQHPHDFTFAPATCSKPAFCVCGQKNGEPLGCADTDGDELCDDCGKNVNYIFEYVEIRTDNNSGVIDTTAGTYIWGNGAFEVKVEKGTSSQLYSTAKDHMRVYKGNNLVLINKTGLTLKTIVVYLTNETQVTNFEKFLTGYTYTKDVVNFTVTVEIDSAEATIIFTNTGSTTQIKGIEFGYEPAPCEHANTTTSTVDATCTVAGSTTVTCTDCGDVVSTTEIPATGHTFADATCTAPKTCSCGATEGEALGHTGHTDDYKCDVCSAPVEPAADSVLTFAQAIALANAMGNNYTTNKYYITGRIVDISNTFNGNFNIVDENGTKFYVYGLKSATGEGNYSGLEIKPVVGDTVTIYTVVGCYDNAPQAKDAWLNGLVQHTEHEWVDATCDTAKHCPICGKTEGEPQHSFVDGVCTGCGKTELTGKVETRTEDFAGLNKSGSYTSATTTSGWQMQNCAVLVGGTTDTNPVFTFIGSSDATKAVTLNGKTASVGKLTSATLSDGISKLSFNYGHAFSEANGVNITINIIQDGVVVATTDLVQASITQKTAYTFTWELDKVVEGDFVIEFVNNSPSQNSKSNKDRVSIFNLSWETAPIAE